ncbi:C40 family peptidase [Cellulomonas triticagri]|uniref:Glycoside hydrolase n=1 Tax=Cellulomonas triticagri TaxID=2483352 RepID=A0A3M2IZ30_9CELL|nr:C40 family peptidase [Cellulomonas triticagri]RMI04920.1 glycoside hydrolase [Cellulomonas triticagri]
MDEVRTTGRARAARSAAAVITAAVLLVPAGGAALADPDVTDQDVRDARRSVQSAAGAVADIEVRLAQLSTQADEAEIAVQQAAEDYAQAQADLAEAQQDAADASAQYDEAQDKLASARSTLVAIAREAARSGGSMETVEALLSADGFQDVVDRNEALSHVSTKADEAVQRYLAAEQVATTFKAKADEAAQAQETAAAEAEQAFDAAETAQSDAEAAVASAQTERQGLITRLAAARSTSAEVEQARQDQVDAERRQRAEAAAQAARTTTPAVSTPATPSTPAPSTPSTPSTPSNPSTPSTPSNPAPSNPAPSNPAPSNPAPVAPPAPTPPPASSGAQTAIAWAQGKIGLPYLWGGTGPNGYDCSGLTQGAWRAAGVSLNRTSRDQYRQVTKISYNDLQPGDLVFWGSNPNDASSVYHVALYIGNGQILEAPSPGKNVKISPMRYANTMAYAGRV